MTSVTGRINEVKQPYGGYLPIRNMTVETYDDGEVLNEKENIAPTLVGLTVDYLTRVVLGENEYEAFEISFRGLSIAERLNMRIETKPTFIPNDLSDESIINAVILANYDSIYRAGPIFYREPELPDKQTIENIRRMVLRSEKFFKDVYPVTQFGFTFEGGYTDTITAGDGDFLTKDGLWDMKVIRGRLTARHSLQLLIYWRMGIHSKYDYFKNVQKLGFFNPRKNQSTMIDVSDISKDVIQEVEKNVIGY